MIKLFKNLKQQSGERALQLSQPVAPPDHKSEAGKGTTANRTGTSDVMDLNFALWRMGFEAQSVIAMRSMGAAGFWNNSDHENQLMIREKQVAFAKGTAKATLAMMRGEAPAAVMLEAVKPMKARTSSNARRLSRRGPRIPGMPNIAKGSPS